MSNIMWEKLSRRICQFRTTIIRIPTQFKFGKCKCYWTYSLAKFSTALYLQYWVHQYTQTLHGIITHRVFSSHDGSYFCFHLKFVEFQIETDGPLTCEACGRMLPIECYLIVRTLQSSGFPNNGKNTFKWKLRSSFGSKFIEDVDMLREYYTQLGVCIRSNLWRNCRHGNTQCVLYICVCLHV